MNSLLSNKERLAHIDCRSLFRSLTMYVHSLTYLDAQLPLLSAELLSKSGYDPKSFQGRAIGGLAHVEEVVERNLFTCKYNIQDGENFGELARRCIKKLDKKVNLLKFGHKILQLKYVDFFRVLLRFFLDKSDMFNKHPLV